MHDIKSPRGGGSDFKLNTNSNNRLNLSDVKNKMKIADLPKLQCNLFNSNRGKKKVKSENSNSNIGEDTSDNYSLNTPGEENRNAKSCKEGREGKDSSRKSSINILQSNRLNINNTSNDLKQKRNINSHRFNLSTNEKISQIEKLKKSIIEEYAKITTKTVSKQKKYIISKWRNVLELLQNLNAKLFLIALKCLADIHIEFDDFEIAKNFCFYYKFFANYLEFPEEVLIVYETLGTVYKYLFQFHKAIKCYKKMIEIAWILNDSVSELRAYDNIGIQYFYLGNKERASYYHHRMIYGRCEDIESNVRDNSSRIYRTKNFYLFNDNIYIKNCKSNLELKQKLRF